jgi:hypothetical protein
MSPDDNSMMNNILRRAGGAAMPADSKPSGSRDFTVQEPGTDAPDNQFVYEPLDTTPGAWAVYPPGVPCDANKTQSGISCCTRILPKILARCALKMFRCVRLCVGLLPTSSTSRCTRTGYSSWSTIWTRSRSYGG